MVTQVQLAAIQPGIRLQADIKKRLEEMGFGTRAFDIASEIAHLVFTSDAVKPEIKAVYMEIDDGGQ